jgi:hypothetical protein
LSARGSWLVTVLVFRWVELPLGILRHCARASESKQGDGRRSVP